jgi:hypothetical protein
MDESGLIGVDFFGDGFANCATRYWTVALRARPVATPKKNVSGCSCVNYVFTI